MTTQKERYTTWYRTHRRSGGVVSQENAEFRKEFDTKEQAIEFAKERAKEAELGQLKVHRMDGNMEYESTYGNDPSRSPS